jgi:hypothetical protein
MRKYCQLKNRQKKNLLRRKKRKLKIETQAYQKVRLVVEI